MPGNLKSLIVAAMLGGTLAAPSLARAEDPAPATQDSTVNQDTGEDQMSIGEVPEVETVELTPDTAKRAIDAYVAVHEKYKDADIENYDNLQDFVDQTPEGKAFEADIKAAGFASVNEWNLAITTESFVYANIVEDQTDDIRQQIADVEADTELAQDMKDRMVKSLKAMIPSENNKTVIAELIKDAAYAEKFKALEIAEE
jgi:hypothetical protein